MKKAILFVITLAQFLIYKPTYSQFICGYHDGSSHSRATGYDTVSAVNLMPLAVQGTYSYGNVPQCTCTLTDITEYPLAHGSNGGIYQCNTDRIISSTTYTHDAYECGLNIRAGRISDGMARPRDVVISNGARVVMDAAQSVSLEPGFKVNAGGRLEVR